MNNFVFIQRWSQPLRLIKLAAALLLGATVALARETDNFSLPLTVEMADIANYLETVHTVALQDTVADVNADIEKALREKEPAVREARLARLHDPLTLMDAFVKRFGHPAFEDKQAERVLQSDWARREYSGHAPSYRDLSLDYSARFVLDPRRLAVSSAQSRTVKAYGIYFGTDKLVHFHHLGADYYRMYRKLVDAGSSPEVSYRKVVKHYAETGVWSEKGFFGEMAGSVYSNADLAVNHVGFLFYRNLTESVVLKRQKREPLLVRSGVFWRLNRHVRPHSGWLGAYISDHWNEALNPNRYDSTLRPGMKRALRERAKSIVAFYHEKDGRPANAAYFENLARELSTYYGTDYGHCGHLDELLNIGNTCFPALKANQDKAPQ